MPEEETPPTKEQEPSPAEDDERQGIDWEKIEQVAAQVRRRRRSAGAPSRYRFGKR